MLNLYFGGSDNNYENILSEDKWIRSASALFDDYFENDWINHSLSRKIILDIDKSTVIQDRVIDSPVLGLIPPMELSGGAKTLLLLLFKPELVYSSCNCGDNCAKWVLEIAKHHDICMSYDHIMRFPEPFEARVANKEKYGEHITTMRGILKLYCDFERGVTV